jgi:flagellar motor switch protein FliG
MNKERYTKQMLLKKSFDMIEAHSIRHITTLIAYLKISKDTFYRKIKVGSKDYERILDAINDKKELEVMYALDKLKELVDKGNLKAIETWLKIYGDDKIRQALSNNYNINANADVTLTEKRKQARDIIANLSEEDKKQLQKILDKYYNNN